MHAYFPALNSFPSLLGDMLADAIGCLGFTWVRFTTFIESASANVLRIDYRPAYAIQTHFSQLTYRNLYTLNSELAWLLNTYIYFFSEQYIY